MLIYLQPAVKLKVNKMVQWTGYNKRAAVLLLRPDGIIKKTAEHRALGGEFTSILKLLALFWMRWIMECQYHQPMVSALDCRY